jgi:hypothetical protein
MEAVSQLPPKRFIENSPEFREVKRLASTMKPYSAEQIAQMQRQRQPRMNFETPGSVTQASGFQTLRHSAFQIQYPANWQVLGNSNSAVTIAPPGGISNDAIAYGVVISAYRPRTQQSLTESTRQIIQALRNSNPSMRLISDAQPININGLQGLAVNLQSPSPLAASNGEPVPERDMLVTVQRPDGSILWMLFIAPEQQFQQLSPTFKRMLDSLQVA